MPSNNLFIPFFEIIQLLCSVHTGSLLIMIIFLYFSIFPCFTLLSWNYENNCWDCLLRSYEFICMGTKKFSFIIIPFQDLTSMCLFFRLLQNGMLLKSRFLNNVTHPKSKYLSGQTAMGYALINSLSDCWVKVYYFQTNVCLYLFIHRTLNAQWCC